jgi:NhaA family Na+:H+ antiporter
LGERIPKGLRIMMLTLAIVDDVGAILVIAIGYTRQIDLAALAWAGGIAAAVLVAARLGVRSRLAYVVLGVLLWFFVHESGVHATIGGVILGLLTPARAYLDQGPVGQFLQLAGERLHGDWDAQRDRVAEVRHLRQAVRESVSPCEYLKDTLHPWVAFGVMPLFALANAGVPASIDNLRSPVAVAVMAGLVVGKPLGIVLASWLSVRAGLARLPAGVTWPCLVGAGCLGGIGFTMALFLANLALDGSHLPAAKMGVLAGSAVSAAVGMTMLLISTRPRRGRPRQEPADPTA